MTRPTLLVDGNNLLIRAVEATRRAAMHSPDGTDTSALVAFISTLSRHTRDYRPYKVVVLWDASSADVPTWRRILYPPYKANRPTAPDDYRRSSRQLVTEFLTLCRIQQHKVLGQEADDLIADYWRQETGDAVILSNDKDLLQLVGPTPAGGQCRQVRLSSTDTATDVWRADRVEEHFGCTPEQLPLVLALAGDSSDNIPGVPGIGPKFAVKHLSAAGWELDQVTHEKIQQHRDHVGLYLQLTNLRDDQDHRAALQQVLPPLSVFMPTTPGPDAAWRALYAFLSGHGMTRTINRLANGELW